MTYVHQILDTAATSVNQGAVATIIQVQGSSYQKEGSMMLLWDNGEKLGMLSVGCIEEELSYYAKECSEAWSIHTFDTKSEDDISWGVGCNGTIHVLVERITPELQKSLQIVHHHLSYGEKIWMIKNLSLHQTLFITEKGELCGNWEGDIPNIATLKSGRENNIYIQCILPQPRLFLFGAGEDAKSVVRLANEMNFLITVCDWREELCSPSHFSEANAFIVGFPKETFPQITLTAYDFVVIMTHNFKRDQELLELFSANPPYYLGILGPRHRTSRIFEGKCIPHWISSPIGLPIGARGDKEIALSIMGEIIQKLRGISDESSGGFPSRRK
ncbi:xanthine dehydrogenase [Bacillus cereus]|uniref:Xanthine dehydrogenase n=1 Tax=Bacillus cereus TaxID=1396 RepID=A0A9X6U5R2_BACCE|nr:XdhC/CoxI family protein [Bacillus cereus]PEN78897.1 xanthine dehydrogenase [Bacillus cereus]